MVEKFVIKKFRGNSEWTYYWVSNDETVITWFGNILAAKRFTTYGAAKEIVDAQKTGIYQIEKIFENEN